MSRSLLHNPHVIFLLPLVNRIFRTLTPSCSLLSKSSSTASRPLPQCLSTKFAFLLPRLLDCTLWQSTRALTLSAPVQALQPVGLLLWWRKTRGDCIRYCSIYLLQSSRPVLLVNVIEAETYGHCSNLLAFAPTHFGGLLLINLRPLC